MTDILSVNVLSHMHKVIRQLKILQNSANNMTTEWAHLPNAKYIDMILANLKAYPKNWDKAWFESDGTAWDVAWATAVSSATWASRSSSTRSWCARGAALGTANSESQTPAVMVASGAILALIIYDDCAYMLDCDINEIKLLAKLGDHKAVILLPAIIAFNRNKSIDK